MLKLRDIRFCVKSFQETLFRLSVVKKFAAHVVGNQGPPPPPLREAAKKTLSGNGTCYPCVRGCALYLCVWLCKKTKRVKRIGV